MGRDMMTESQDRALLGELLARPGDRLRRESEGAYLTYELLPDLYGRPAYVLRVRTQLEVAALGLDALQSTLVFLLLTGVAFMAAIWVALQRLMVGPITGRAGRVGRLLRRAVSPGLSRSRTNLLWLVWRPGLAAPRPDGSPGRRADHSARRC